MRLIDLPNSGRRTSQLSFGCAYLTPASASLLDVAYDAGIRHFDVGRSYNRGQAEDVLGRFISRRGSEISVTSKYGILPEVVPVHLRVARKLFGSVVRQLRDSGALRQPPVASGMHQLKRAAFTASEARASLETSLRLLRQDRLDLFLMHEATPDELQDERLLAFLQQAVEQGVIGAFGVGGPSAQIAALRTGAPEYCKVLQFDWSPLDRQSVEAPFSARYRVCSHKNPRLTWRVGDHELQTIRAFASTFCKAFSDNGYGRIILDPGIIDDDEVLRGTVIDSLHHIGGARMASSAEEGVVDADLKLFGTTNAYVCSSAVFPSAGYVNPTHTIIALAVRLAEHLASSSTP